LRVIEGIGPSKNNDDGRVSHCLLPLPGSIIVSRVGKQTLLNGGAFGIDGAGRQRRPVADDDV